MDLDVRQTRGLFLAGTVSFPAPFPTLGTIALDMGQLSYSRGQAPHADPLLLVIESCGNETIVRIMLQADVSAVFIPGKMDGNGVFQISQAAQAGDLEEGEWFLDGDIDANTILQRLNLPAPADISTRNSVLRGIVFVREDRPLLRSSEIAYTAGADAEQSLYICCTCKYPEYLESVPPFFHVARISCAHC